MKLLLLLSFAALGIGLADCHANREASEIVVKRAAEEKSAEARPRPESCKCYALLKLPCRACDSQGCRVVAYCMGNRGYDNVVTKRAIEEEKAEVKRDSCNCRGRSECTGCDNTGCHYTPSCSGKREAGDIVVKRAIEEETAEEGHYPTCECRDGHCRACFKNSCKKVKECRQTCLVCITSDCSHVRACRRKREAGEIIVKRAIGEEITEVKRETAHDMCICPYIGRCRQCDSRGNNCHWAPSCSGKREAGEVVVKRAIEEETAEALPALFTCECPPSGDGPCRECAFNKCRDVKECIGQKGFGDVVVKRAIEEETAEATRRAKRACGVLYEDPKKPPRCYSFTLIGYYHYVPCEECKT